MPIKRLEIFRNVYKDNPNAYIFDFYGPRGSGKTTEVSYETLEDIWEGRGDTLVLRKKKTKVKNSVKKEIEHLLAVHGFSPYFNVYNDRIEKKTQKGEISSKWVFEGAHDILDLKSYSQFRNVWLEEANQFSAEDIEILLPTLRQAGSRVFLTSNISPRNHWLSKKIRGSVNPLICSVKSTYKDNIYLNNGDSKGWLEKQRVAYEGNDLGYRIEILGEELEFSTARVIRDYELIDADISADIEGRVYCGVAVKGNSAGFVFLKIINSNNLNLVIITNSFKRNLSEWDLITEKIIGTDAIFVFEEERAEMRSSFSRLGVSSLLIRPRKFFALNDFLLKKEFLIENSLYTEPIRAELEKTEYYYLDEHGQLPTNYLDSKDTLLLEAFRNALSPFMRVV